ncbi:tryptophanyl-tRNA synthetase [Deinobacterium chartae]|uniref:Tryptophan--tRNA ligase n=1 Tax=Deinobacterium chartae TaxID=521158 RepID=A0A841HWL7_9DEIO|nr:tryptophan--tRNA ligase [Deinobacterium chartae]MBB6097316.1 tryptophanyl-tRNA synthetase [Deinobacterium chartae]
MTRAFSGIQPTGDIHIGNYFGAMQNYVKLGRQLGKQAIFCIVDYHAITIPHEPEALRRRSFEAALVNMAVGLDPEQVTLFVQSAVPEHTELAWIFMTQTPLGDLERMTQFKDKAKQHSVLSGLLTYPVLMAADILAYKADTIPVGEDQVQHIELTREIARRFNGRFGEIFPEPRAVHAKDALRVPGVDGQGKMSKSKGNTLGILEEVGEIWSKLRVAPTDPARLRRTDPGDPHRCLIFDYHRLFSDPALTAMVETECARAGIGCVDCKKFLMRGVERTLVPIQDRAAELRRQPDAVLTALETGAREARALARQTLEETREAIGLLRTVALD